METNRIVEACKTAGTHRLNQYNVCQSCNAIYAARTEANIARQASAITDANPQGVRVVVQVTGCDDTQPTPVGLNRTFASAELALAAEAKWSNDHEGAEYTVSLYAVDGSEIDYPDGVEAAERPLVCVGQGDQYRELKPGDSLLEI